MHGGQQQIINTAPWQRGRNSPEPAVFHKLSRARTHTHPLHPTLYSAPCTRLFRPASASPPQEKKQLVFEGTVGRDVEALGRLTEDDLRFLFG